MALINRSFEDTTRHNVKMQDFRDVVSGVKHARLHNVGGRNEVDIFWDLNEKSIRHELFKIKLTGYADGKKVKLEAVIPYEELAYYARDF